MAKRKKIEETQVLDAPIVLGDVHNIVQVDTEGLYKCIECGQINESVQCKRCGGHIARKL
jgi:rRNA maturation endonuclease Nob1